MKAYKLILFSFVIVLLLFLLVFYGFQKINNTEYYIFTDIAECEQVVSNKSDDAQIEIYETPEKDKYLRNLKYEAFFGVKYMSSGMRFQLFAYDFADSETARAYYEAVTGKDGALITDVFAENGLFSSDLIVRVDDKAYRVTMPSRHTRRVTDYLNEIFTFSTKDSYTLHLLTPLTEEMVRFYYDLAPEDEITQEMLNGVTSLTVFRTQALDGKFEEVTMTYFARHLTEMGADPTVYSIEKLREKCVIDYCVNSAVTEGDSFASLRHHALAPIGDFRGFKIGDETVVKAETVALIPERHFETVIRPAFEAAWGKNTVFTKQTVAYYQYRQMPQGDQTHEWAVRVDSGYTGAQSFYYFDIGAAFY